MEHYLVIKRHEVLIHATPQMNVERLMLKVKEPVMEDHILYDSFYMKCPK